MPAPRGDSDAVLAGTADAHDPVGLESRLAVVGARSGVGLLEQVVQSHDGRVRENHIAEAGQVPLKSPARAHALLECSQSGLLEHLRKARCEPVVEAALLDGLPRSLLVGAPQSGNAALPPHTEAEHHGPEQLHRADLAHALDGRSGLRQRDQELRREELVQRVANGYCVGLGHRLPPSLVSQPLDAARWPSFHADPRSVAVLSERPCSSLLQGKTKPNLAKVTIARQIAAITLSLWKKEECYSAAKVKKTT